ncbi:MAG: hypothetical protein RBR87_08995 [Bacteroidales bacterium]|jgi:hypothetical protein|nr:hypothetical protein [Bacteroidales bacterium]
MNNTSLKKYPTVRFYIITLFSLLFPALNFLQLMQSQQTILLALLANKEKYLKENEKLPQL